MRRRHLLLLLGLAPLAVGSAALAFWSTSGTASATARTADLNPPAAVTATASGPSVTVGWGAAALTTGQPATGYSVARLTGAATTPVCGGTITALSCVDTHTNDGTYRYVVTAHYASWTTASAPSAPVTVVVDSTPPVIGHTFPKDGKDYADADWTGLFGCVPNGLCGTASDPSGVSSVAVSIRQGSSGLFWGGSAFDQAAQTFVPATGTTSWSLPMARPIDGTYSLQVRATDGAGNVTASPATVNFRVDATGPAGATISSPTEYRRTLSVPLTVTNGVDAGVGVDAASGVITRAASALTNGTCAAFPSATPITLTNGSDTSVTNGTCYSYTYRVKDLLGNASAAVSVVVKVDTTAPVNALTVGEGNGAFLDGTTLYFSNSAANNFLNFANTVTDTGSGRASTTYPDIATASWTHAAETITTVDVLQRHVSTVFNRPAGAVVPAPYTITSADKAGNTTATTVNFVVDNDAPTGGQISYPAGYYPDGNVPITLAPASDPSGVSTTSFVFRNSSVLTNGVCSTTAGPSTIVTLTNGVDTTALSGNCYVYRNVLRDRVGNLTQQFPAGVDQLFVGDAGVVKIGRPVVTAVTLTNSGVAGQINQGDQISLTFSDELTPSSICSAWTTTGNQSLAGNNDVTVTVTGTTGGDLLVVTSPRCTLNLGTINLGGAYLNTGAVATFGGNGSNVSTLAWDATAKRLRVTLGRKDNTSVPLPNVPTAPASWTAPTQGVRPKDLRAVEISTAPVSTSGQRL